MLTPRAAAAVGRMAGRIHFRPGLDAASVAREVRLGAVRIGPSPVLHRLFELGFIAAWHAKAAASARRSI